MNISKDGHKIVLSASRMTDMPMFYPEEIIRETAKRMEKGMAVHTLVLWTKFPRSLLVNPLKEFLVKLRSDNIQIYVQLTISGLGNRNFGNLEGKSLYYPEPNVPEYPDSLQALPEVIALIGNPERIKLRIDPIIKVEDFFGQRFSNLIFFQEIVQASAKMNIKDFVFSILVPGIHKKADRRFKSLGIGILKMEDEEIARFMQLVNELQDKYQIRISSCCVNGLPESKCIDGEVLKNLHDSNADVNLKQMRRRELCGCTLSIDIGGWPPKKCYSGCDYCYSNSYYKKRDYT